MNELCSLIRPGISRALGGLLIEFLKEVFCIRVWGKLRLSFLCAKTLHCDVGVVKRRRHCKCLSADMNAWRAACHEDGTKQGPLSSAHLESWAGRQDPGPGMAELLEKCLVSWLDFAQRCEERRNFRG